MPNFHSSNFLTCFHSSLVIIPWYFRFNSISCKYRHQLQLGLGHTHSECDNERIRPVLSSSSTTSTPAACYVATMNSNSSSSSNSQQLQLSPPPLAPGSSSSNGATSSYEYQQVIATIRKSEKGYGFQLKNGILIVKVLPRRRTRSLSFSLSHSRSFKQGQILILLACSIECVDTPAFHSGIRVGDIILKVTYIYIHSLSISSRSVVLNYSCCCCCCCCFECNSD